MLAYVEDIHKINKERFETVIDASTSFAREVDSIVEESKDYSKRSLENAQDFVNKLFGVKKVEDAIALQSDFVKTAHRDLVDQAFKIGGLYLSFAAKVLSPAEKLAAKKPGPIFAKARIE